MRTSSFFSNRRSRRWLLTGMFWFYRHLLREFEQSMNLENNIPVSNQGLFAPEIKTNEMLEHTSGASPKTPFTHPRKAISFQSRGASTRRQVCDEGAWPEAGLSYVDVLTLEPGAWGVKWYNKACSACWAPDDQNVRKFFISGKNCLLSRVQAK